MYIFVNVVYLLFYYATLSRQIAVTLTDCVKGANITITSAESTDICVAYIFSIFVWGVYLYLEIKVEKFNQEVSVFFFFIMIHLNL